MNQLNNTTIILIGHDLTTITQWATRITVMYCGQSVESADTAKLLAKPKHPYTVALLKQCRILAIGFRTKRSCNLYQVLFHHCSTYRLVAALGLVAPMRKDNAWKSLALNALRIINTVVTSLLIRRKKHECVVRSLRIKKGLCNSI